MPILIIELLTTPIELLSLRNMPPDLDYFQDSTYTKH